MGGSPNVGVGNTTGPPVGSAPGPFDGAIPGGMAQPFNPEQQVSRPGIQNIFQFEPGLAKGPQPGVIGGLGINPFAMPTISMQNQRGNIPIFNNNADPNDPAVAARYTRSRGGTSAPGEDPLRVSRGGIGARAGDRNTDPAAGGTPFTQAYLDWASGKFASDRSMPSPYRALNDITSQRRADADAKAKADAAAAGEAAKAKATSGPNFKTLEGNPLGAGAPIPLTDVNAGSMPGVELDASGKASNDNEWGRMYNDLIQYKSPEFTMHEIRKAQLERMSRSSAGGTVSSPRFDVTGGGGNQGNAPFGSFGFPAGTPALTGGQLGAVFASMVPGLGWAPFAAQQLGLIAPFPIPNSYDPMGIGFGGQPGAPGDPANSSFGHSMTAGQQSFNAGYDDDDGNGPGNGPGGAPGSSAGVGGGVGDK